MGKLILAILSALICSSAFAGTGNTLLNPPPGGDTTITIYFHSIFYEITDVHKPILDRVVRMLKMHTEDRIDLSGFTDDEGPEEYNLALSQRRAESVATYLKNAGINAARITSTGLGEASPRKSNSTEAGKKLNRRVEMKLYKPQAKQAATKDKKTITYPFILYGNVKAEVTGEPLKAEIVVEANDENKGNRRIGSDSLSGNYRGIIALSSHYIINCYADGFLSRSIVVDNNRRDSLQLNFELKRISIKQKLVFEHIYFHPNKDILLEQSYHELRELHAMLSKDPYSVIEIQGHMNSPLYIKQTPQRQADNFDLSYRRARAVYNYLVSRGINRDRMSYRGMSNFKMIFPYAISADEMQRNMRVEIIEIEK